MNDTITKEPAGYNAAMKAVVSSKEASTSFIQRQLKVSYAKAATLMERLEVNGVVSKPNQKGQRLVNLDLLQIPNHERAELPTVDQVADAHGITDPVVTGAAKMMVGEELNTKEKAVAAATEAAMGHNSKANGPDLLNMNDQLTETARDKLRLTVERIERLEEEKKEVAEQIKEVKSEAKALGFDVKAINSVIKLRKIDRQERQEQEAILEVYLDAVGEL
jgi:uncharacterized protein (UPF0335 family)